MKPASRYILKFFLYGAAVGVVAGHPLFMVAHHLHEYFGSQVPLRVTQAILHSFSLHAWPLTLFFAVIGGAVGAALGRLHHRLEAHRLSYQARLRALAAEISLAEERERRRLANELHEQVGQILAAARIKLGVLATEVQSPTGLAALQEAREHVEASIRYVRSLTGELSPPVLYEMGFAPAVIWLARQIRDQYGIEVELQQHPIVWPPCDDSQILLFIIFRDLLTHVAGQARPREIKIVMRTEGKVLLIRVEHDGLEVSDGGEPSGFVLFSIRERLDRIGGTVAVEATPGRGSVITLKVPLCQQIV
ncbi:MAG: histidine kinase [Deltaproteobacteria bacterium]|nr:histidine kinase [Deltaproteobacteria bacterium]